MTAGRLGEDYDPASSFCLVAADLQRAVIDECNLTNMVLPSPRLPVACPVFSPRIRRRIFCGIGFYDYYEELCNPLNRQHTIAGGPRGSKP